MPDPVFDRQDAETLLFLMTDILTELREIRRLLEDEEEEEGFRE